MMDIRYKVALAALNRIYAINTELASLAEDIEFYNRYDVRGEFNEEKDALVFERMGLVQQRQIMRDVISRYYAHNREGSGIATP